MRRTESLASVRPLRSEHGTHAPLGSGGSASTTTQGTRWVTGSTSSGRGRHRPRSETLSRSTSAAMAGLYPYAGSVAGLCERVTFGQIEATIALPVIAPTLRNRSEERRVG